MAQYGHTPGRIAVTGGYVLGSQYGDLEGQYVFGDFPTSGRLFHVSFDEMLAAVTEGDPGDLTQATIRELAVLFDDDDNPNTPSIATTFADIVKNDPDFVEVLASGAPRIDLRFGQGPDGTLYLLNKRNGSIYQAVQAPEPTALLLLVLGILGMVARMARRRSGSGTSDFRWMMAVFGR